MIDWIENTARGLILLGIDVADFYTSSKLLIVLCILLAWAVFYVLFIRVLVHFDYYNRVVGSRVVVFMKSKLNFLRSYKKPIEQKPWFIKISFIKKFYDMYIFIPQKISWNTFLILLLTLSVGVYWYLVQNLSDFLSIVITLIIISGICFAVVIQAQNQREKIVAQLPSFLLALSNALQAGYSLNSGFGFIVNEVEDPLQSELIKIVNKLKLNIEIGSALEDFSQSINHKDIDFFTESTIIQLQTGGNLISLFKKISKLIEDRIKLKQDLKTFTSQGKYSGIIIASLWFLSLFLFWIIAPQHIYVLFNTPIGQTLLGVSLLLEIVGFWLIWKITSIKF